MQWQYGSVHNIPMKTQSLCTVSVISHTQYNNNNNDIKILIKREPLVYTRARRAVQRKTKNKKREKKKARTVQQQ